MKLSAPIHVLKSRAKNLKRSESMTMTEALDQIAKEQGFQSWSLLISKSEQIYPKQFDEVLNFCNPGDLVVVASRPGFGKTSFALGLFVQAINEDRAISFYFTLSETHIDIAGRIASYDKEIGEDDSKFRLDYSDDISADYIINKAKGNTNKASVIVVDYLQLLDEKRSNPPVQTQIEKLKVFAKDTGCIIIFLSQVSREIEYRNDKSPRFGDLRLPNPLDLKLFNKGILLYRKSKDTPETEVTIECGSTHKFQILWDKKNTKFY